MTITLDNRFLIKATSTYRGWVWVLWDHFDEEFGYVAPKPAKDQTEVFLLAAEVIKERY